MPAKLRRKSAAPTRRGRGGPARVARSPGAHGSRQLLRCPRKPTKHCGSVHSFLLVENLVYVDHWIRSLYFPLNSRPTPHTTRENRAHSAGETPLLAPFSPPRYIRRSADLNSCCCILLLLLLCYGYCFGYCCCYCYNC